jgi:hypothetical protein
MTIAVQSLGLVMALQIVKTRRMAVTLPAMIWMVVIVPILSVAMVSVTVVKPKQTARKTAAQVVIVQTVNLIGQLTDLNAVIRHGVSMALIVLHWKAPMAGIVLVVTALVMVIQFVVMVFAMVMKPMKHVQKIVMHLANVTPVI